MTDSALSVAAPGGRLRSLGPWLAGAVIVVGIFLRLGLMRHYNDDPNDLNAVQTTSTLLFHHFLHAYRGTIHGRAGDSPSWTYPAGYFPVMLIDHVLVHAGVSLRTLLAVPNYLADIAMAVLSYRYLAARRGHGAALAGCALVSLGWPLFLDTAVMNQIDSITTLFALGALMIWSSGGRHRLVWACLCLGIATSFKTPFGFLVLAILPTCDGWRERARAIGIVAGVPLLVTAPFLIADFHSVARAITSNHGLPGFAGWSLFVEPAFRHVWLDKGLVHQSGTLRTMSRWAPEIVVVVLLAVGATLWRYRVDAVRAGAIVALAVWASNVNPVPTFLVWLLPFLILNGQLWAAGAIELAGLIPAIQLFLLNPHPGAEGLYVPFMALLQAVIIVILALSIATAIRQRTGPLREGGPTPSGVGSPA